LKVLLTGAGGQIGTALRRQQPAAVELVNLWRRPPADANSDAGSDSTRNVITDLTNFTELTALLQQQRFDVIINAAAWTAVDAAEQQPHSARQMNAELPALLAAQARRQDALLLHYSTDYVHDGSKSSAYIEADEPAPLNVYGNSKLAGDQAIIVSGCRYLLLRTSWVYGGPSRNFLHTIAARMCQGQSLHVVDDQIGCPTWSLDIARCSWQVLTADAVQHGFNAGLYHLAGVDGMSWYDFAREIHAVLAAANVVPETTSLHACGSDDYPQQAKRPPAVLLDSTAFKQRFGCVAAGSESIRQATLGWLQDAECRQINAESKSGQH